MKKRIFDILAVIVFLISTFIYVGCEEDEQSIANEVKKFSVEYKVSSPLVGYERVISLNETGKLHFIQTGQIDADKPDTFTTVLKPEELKAFLAMASKINKDKSLKNYDQQPIGQQMIINRSVLFSINGQSHQLYINKPEEMPFNLTLLLSSVEELSKKYQDKSSH
ncbi:MAG: hypothetical protein Q8862_04125 [Bacteroidota bacterium]|nr:hypothetical protein [Bacteroidota bacterium]MDP4206017.1 hypothetical protein [Bacteroidota bacterium]